MGKTKITKLWDHKVTRFIVVGCFNTIFDITLLLLFYKVVGLSEVVANTFSVAIAVSVSYFLNHRIVFRYKKKYSWRNYLRFLLVTGLSIVVVQNILIYIVTQLLWDVPESQTFEFAGQLFMTQTAVLLGAKLLAVGIGMVWNFLLYKYVVFAHNDQDESDEILIV